MPMNFQDLYLEFKFNDNFFCIFLSDANFEPVLDALSQFQAFKMKTAPIFCVLFIFVVFVHSEEYPKCPENEVFDSCYSQCETNCGGPTGKCTADLEAECVPGCRCAEGFARNSITGKCGSGSECPPDCKEFCCTLDSMTNFAFSKLVAKMKSFLLVPKVATLDVLTLTVMANASYCVNPAALARTTSLSTTMENA
jgi:hypothetical protein